jgi:hypothetical protein
VNLVFNLTNPDGLVFCWPVEFPKFKLISKSRNWDESGTNLRYSLDCRHRNRVQHLKSVSQTRLGTSSAGFCLWRKVFVLPSKAFART